MNKGRRIFIGSAVALACAPLAAAPRYRIAQLEYTSVFFAPHLARAGLLRPGVDCALEVDAHGVMVYAKGHLLGLLASADAAVVTSDTGAQIHQVWTDAANTTRVSVRMEMPPVIPPRPAAVL